MSLHKNRAKIVVVPVFNSYHAYTIYDMLNRVPNSSWQNKHSIGEMIRLGNEVGWVDSDKDYHCCFAAYSMPCGKVIYTMYTHLSKSYIDNRLSLNKFQLKRWLGLQVNTHGDLIPLVKYALVPVKATPKLKQSLKIEVEIEPRNWLSKAIRKVVTFLTRLYKPFHKFFVAPTTK